MATVTPGVDGILIVAKDPGYTSQDVVAIVRRLTGTRKAGHGGTLDPFAAGVLPVFLGLGTRVVEYHMADDKAYRATVCFGATSETDDRDGELRPGTGPVPVREAVESALAGFRGQILQRPPDYSALKVAGRRAYDLARQGTPAELAPRAVVIKRVELVEWNDSDAARPTAVLEVECGAGTYIRSLARDLGEVLGCGAYLGALSRTASGRFNLAAAHSLDEIRAAAEESPAALAKLLLPIESGLEEIPSATLSADEVAAVCKGQLVKPAHKLDLAAGGRVRMLAEDGSLVGVASWKGGKLAPDKIFLGAASSSAARAAAAADDGGDSGASGDADGARSGSAHDATAAEPKLRVIDPRNKMVVVPGVSALTPGLGRLYLAVGVFDGLHRGHLYLLRELCRAARRAGARPAVITFDAHPEELIEGLAPPLLCDPEERLVRLQAAGIEVTVVQHFDHALRTTPYDAFVAMVREHVDVAGFVMTPDAAFGYERGGTPETLAALGEHDGFAVTVVSSFLSNGEQVRSSEIRRRIGVGDLSGARSLLGRSLGVTGRIGSNSDDPAAESEVLASEGVDFELPVSLPPDGRYSVVVGPAWGRTLPPIPASRPAAASVVAGSVRLEPPLASDRGSWRRIVFNTAAPEG